MVYIQGESFENGDASLYGAENLLDWEVVVVTFNYRIGTLGFLSTGDEHASGNWGLYDQHMVLRWVHDHIESFSGDVNSVTVFGQGAGLFAFFLVYSDPLHSRCIVCCSSPDIPFEYQFVPQSDCPKWIALVLLVNGKLA